MLGKFFHILSGRVLDRRKSPAKETITKDPEILLIQCPPWDTTMPPLGVSYLSEYLLKHGISNSIYDMNIDMFSSVGSRIKYLWQQNSYDQWADDALFKLNWPKLKNTVFDKLKQLFKSRTPKYIGLSVNFAGINFAKEIIRIVKKISPGSAIIVGGWGCVNDHMRKLFPQELVDVFVVGEGEVTLKEVVDVLSGRNDAAVVPGAIFNEKYRKNGFSARPMVAELDNLPWPKYKGLDLRKYKYRILPLFTSRGCIGKCSFCNDWVMTASYRWRSANNILDEVRYHVKENNISSFSFKDLLCNGNIQELSLWCDLLSKSQTKISWDSQAIPRKEMEPWVLEKLKKSGCQALVYGVESFSNNVLRKMKKIFTKEIAEKVIRDTHEAGISVLINIIVGFPGETEEDFMQTYRALEENREFIDRIGAISVCLINNDSDLDLNYKDYNIVLSPDLSRRAKYWHTSDSRNTYELRNERARKIIELTKKLYLKNATQTI